MGNLTLETQIVKSKHELLFSLLEKIEELPKTKFGIITNIVKISNFLELVFRTYKEYKLYKQHLDECYRSNQLHTGNSESPEPTAPHLPSSEDQRDPIQGG